MKPSEIARAAAKLLEEGSWVQNTLVTNTGSMCAMGACVKASGYDTDKIKGHGQYTLAVADDPELVKALNKINGGPSYEGGMCREWPSLVQLNDRAGTSKTEVIKALKERATALEGEGL